MYEPYVYKITVVAFENKRWLVSVFWSNNVINSYGDYRWRWVAAAVANRLASERVEAQGTNKRLDVQVFDRELTVVSETAYGRDPRSRT